MSHPLAGKKAPAAILENIPKLIAAYYTRQPDSTVSGELVSFGTSGHRGSSLKNSFNEAHIFAITQAVCDYRKDAGIDGTLFMGMDTHALSYPAQLSALQVLGANGVDVRIAQHFGYAPTPVISHAILTHNHTGDLQCDGIVITPSHNPPSDGGFKYNPPNGGPADTDVTDVIQERANAILSDDLKEVKKVSLSEALTLPNIQEYDYVTPYVEDLKNVIDMESISASGIRIGADAMGGSGLEYYAARTL